jgi:hypothetical protein
MSKYKTILKHNQLQLLSSKFDSIDEQRFLNSCLSDNWQREMFEETGYYPVNIVNYASKQNIGIGKAFTELRNFAQEFTKELYIELDSGETWVTRIVYDYKYDSVNKTLSVRFNKDLIPFISGAMQAGDFVIYDNRMDSVPSNRRFLMGELLQKYLYKLDKDGKFLLPLKDIRKGLNLKETEYKQYAQLNKVIIKPTLKDFADIQGIYMVSKKTSLGTVFTRVLREDFYEGF